MAGRTTMGFGEAVLIAAASLWAHKLRSVLTLLGVVIAVTSVIAVVSFINGANRYVAERVFSLGADVFVLQRGSAIVTNIEQFQEIQKRKNLEWDDYLAVREGCTSCAAVGASVGRRVEVRYGANSVLDSSLRGLTPSMARISDFELAAGRYLTDGDLNRAAPVCVIGWDIVANLFPGVDPLGKPIRAASVTCEVIGAGKKLGSTLGQSRDNYVLIPISAYQKTYGTRQSLTIWGKSAGAEGLERTVDEARQLMRGRRKLGYFAKEDFSIETHDSFLSVWSGISSAFFLVVIGIASISLVVGGIVIMNIMLVSVTERTSEIGLRKSLGARRSDILAQFLIESATIAAIGGLWGILLGILLAKGVSWVTPLPSAIEPWSVLAGLLVSTSVGLFFGIYPASKAARLDPVVALRAE
jgi:putative ABC transport system permease protein